MSLNATIKSIQDILRKDAGVDGDAQRISQLCWMLFLKILDAKEEEAELIQNLYLEGRKEEAAAAVPELARALSLYGEFGGEPSTASDIRFTLAQALVAAGQGGARARGLAELARADYEQAGDDEQRERVEAWLAAQP